MPEKPTTIGHEAVGKVVKYGKDVTGYSEGDEITFSCAHRACWKCAACSSHFIFCTAGTMKLQGYGADGFMQEYCVVDAVTAAKLPAGMDAAQAAPISCAGITAYNAMRKTNLENGQWVAVIGCGGLGQMGRSCSQQLVDSPLIRLSTGIRYAKAMGFKVIAIDVSDESLAPAKEAGVEHAFNSRSGPDFENKIHGITGGGVQAVVVFTAAKGGYDLAPKLLMFGGRLVFAGLPAEPVTLDAMDVALEKYIVVGASNNGTAASMRECLDFSFAHGIQSPTRFFKVEEFPEAVELMKNGKLGGVRPVIKW